MTDTYDDGTIVCGPDRLEIHYYYFPFGTKSVPYASIRGLQRTPPTPTTRRWTPLTRIRSRGRQT